MCDAVVGCETYKSQSRGAAAVNWLNNLTLACVPHVNVIPKRDCKTLPTGTRRTHLHSLSSVLPWSRSNGQDDLNLACHVSERAE